MINGVALLGKLPEMLGYYLMIRWSIQGTLWCVRLRARAQEGGSFVTHIWSDIRSGMNRLVFRKK